MTKKRSEVRRGPGQRRRQGQTRDSRTPLREFEGIKLGMTSNDVLRVPYHSSKYALQYPGHVVGKGARGLVVRWLYRDCAITFRRRYGPGGPASSELEYRVSHIRPGMVIVKGREIDERVLTGEIGEEIDRGKAESGSSNDENDREGKAQPKALPAPSGAN